MEKVRRATGDEIAWLLAMAAAEGWNPGLEDATAFHAADTSGFWIALDHERPVAGISVVRQDARHGFLGLYLCEPASRGQGHGWRAWQAGLEHLDGRTVGLDGVVEQQDNYRRSGFEFAWRNLRFTGPAPRPDSTVEMRRSTPESVPALVAFDREIGGVDRSDWLSIWFGDTRTRRTRWIPGGPTGSAPQAVGTIRRCREHCKIGPLLAATPELALQLLGGLAATLGAEQIVLDVPEPNESGTAIARRVGLEVVFETARMYRGPAPRVDLGRLFGVATLELG